GRSLNGPSHHRQPAVAARVGPAFECAIGTTLHGGQTGGVPVEADAMAQPSQPEQRLGWEVRLDDYRARLVFGVNPVGRDGVCQRHAEIQKIEQRLNQRGDLAGAGWRSDHQKYFAIAVEKQRWTTASYGTLPWRDRIASAWHRVEHAHVAVVLKTQS